MVFIVKEDCRRYGFFNFLLDCFMVIITAGFWLIWIFIREMRKR
jgi:hypothetical protein